MVAALQSPPEFRPRRPRPQGTRLRLVPDPDLRPARPRVTRSTRASVFWRRRLIAAALGLGIVLAAAHAGTALGGSTTSTPERRPHVVKVVAHEGDTLWSIAERVAPGSDPRKVVDEIAAARGTADVRAGEQIQVTL